MSSANVKVAQHTPGPWRVIKGGENVVGRDGMFVAQTIISTHAIPDPEVRANARLIAAAPELLASAKKALNYIENTEGELGINLGCGDALRAAIAKAKAR